MPLLDLVWRRASALLVVFLALTPARATDTPLAAAPAAPTASSIAPGPRGLDPRKDVTQYPLDVWTEQRGLPNDHVQALAQTDDGYLWVATEQGLGRFDGASVTVFDHTTYAGFYDDSVTALHAESGGRLWIGTSRGLLRYDRGTFSPVTFEGRQVGGLVRTILAARDGAVWCGGNTGLVRIGRDGAVQAFTKGHGLPDDMVWTAAEDGAGRIWVGTRRGLVRIEGSATTVFGADAGLPSDDIRAVEIGPGGTMWVGTVGGLARLDPQLGDRFTRVGGLSDDNVVALCEDAGGTVWIGTSAGGLNVLRHGQVSTLTIADGLLSNGVHVLLFDREGNLWLGGFGGLSRLRDGMFTTLGSRAGLASNEVWTVMEDGAGVRWFGTQNGLTRDDGTRVTTFTARDGLGHNTIVALGTSRDGTTWIGTHGGGLGRMKDGRLRTFTMRDGLGSNDIRAILEDRHGTLWVGTMGGGLNRYDGRAFEVFGRRQGLSSDIVHALYADADNTIWIGTGGGGLCRHAGGTLSCVGRPQGLAADSVFGIIDAGHGAMWLATDQGLVLAAGGRFTALTTREGLNADKIWAVVADGEGHLWLTSNRGLAKLRASDVRRFLAGELRTVDPVVYGIADGLPTKDFSGAVSPAIWKTRDGRILCATSRGVVFVDPKATDPIVAPTRVFVEHAEIDLQRVDIGSVVQAPPGPGRVVVRYAAPFFLAPERLRYAVKLEGFDPDWIDVGTRHEAVYTNVPPGRYTFRVRVRTDAGTWGDAEATFPFALTPRVYQTRAFKTLSVLGLGVAVAGGVGWRLRRARARQRELQRRVDEALSQVKTLRGLIPMCAWCGKVRDDEGYWSRVESYIQDHSDAKVSHGLCPSCVDTHFADMTRTTQES